MLVPTALKKVASESAGAGYPVWFAHPFLSHCPNVAVDAPALGISLNTFQYVHLTAWIVLEALVNVIIDLGLTIVYFSSLFPAATAASANAISMGPYVRASLLELPIPPML